ncbi:hypothetical protein ACFE04_010584 [Oxalis oulophora]
MAASRRTIETRSTQPPGMMRHTSIPDYAHHELLENKIAIQAAEIQRLASDKHKLATSHVVLKQDVVVAQQEVQKLKAHLRSIHAESDIQLRVLQDKIARKENDIRNAENVARDLQKAHEEAQCLVKARDEVAVQIDKVSKEMQKALADVSPLPDLLKELDCLRNEHHRLRAAFEYEKRSNIEQVGQMQSMEKNLIGMAKEVENLRAEILNVEKRTHVQNPQSGSFNNPNPSYPPLQAGGAYVDVYGRPLVQMGAWPVQFGIGPGMTPPAGSGSSGNVVWGRTNDPSFAPR